MCAESVAGSEQTTATCPAPVRVPEQLAHGTIVDAWVVRLPFHGEGLAGPSLPIGKDAHIVPVKGANDELADFLEHSLLLALRPKYAVEVKGLQRSSYPSACTMSGECVGE